jgi:hypothetical protein
VEIIHDIERKILCKIHFLGSNIFFETTKIFKKDCEKLVRDGLEAWATAPPPAPPRCCFMPSQFLIPLPGKSIYAFVRFISIPRNFWALF